MVLSFFSFKNCVSKVMREFEPDIIFSTSNPLTTSVFALYASKKYGVDFIPEFRDPWILNPLRTWPTYLHYLLERHMENRVYVNAKDIVVNTCSSRSLLLKAYPRINGNKVHVLSHSFDTANVTISEGSAEVKHELTIGYAGGFYIDKKKSFLQNFVSYRASKSQDVDSSPVSLLRAVEELNDSYKDIIFKVVFIGTKREQILGLLSEGMSEFVSFVEGVPRDRVAEKLSSCDCVFITNPLIVESPFISTKTYDYIALDKPILAELEEGEQLRVLKESGLCFEVKPRSVANMKEVLLKMIKTPTLQKNMNFVSLFERSRQVDELVQILEITSDNRSGQLPVITEGLLRIK